MEDNMAERRALVVGASGISGYNTAHHLVQQGWEVYGVSRREPQGLDGVTPILVDVTDAGAVASALGDRSFTHVFYCTWARQETEAENCRVNGGMLRNVLEAVVPRGRGGAGAAVAGAKDHPGAFEGHPQTPNQKPFRAG